LLRNMTSQAVALQVLGDRLTGRAGGALPQQAADRCGGPCVACDAEAEADAPGVRGTLPTPQEMARAQVAEWTRDTTADATAPRDFDPDTCRECGADLTMYDREDADGEGLTCRECNRRERAALASRGEA
jgi:hypothetical protein